LPKVDKNGSVTTSRFKQIIPRSGDPSSNKAGDRLRGIVTTSKLVSGGGFLDRELWHGLILAYDADILMFRARRVAGAAWWSGSVGYRAASCVGRAGASHHGESILVGSAD
jgi:hypothetical protein